MLLRDDPTDLCGHSGADDKHQRVLLQHLQLAEDCAFQQSYPAIVLRFIFQRHRIESGSAGALRSETGIFSHITSVHLIHHFRRFRFQRNACRTESFNG